MQKIDLEGLSNHTKGMPDSWHIDAAGKSSPEVFQKRFGLPRSMRNDKSILSAAYSRETRLTQFVGCLLHYRNLSLPFMLVGDRHTSPEAHAMARYDEGWHLRNEQDLTEVVKLEDGDLQQKLSALLAVRRDKRFRLHQVKIQALANRTDSSMDRAFEVMCKCAMETWLRARNDLASWDQIDNERRECLAEVAFAGFTFFGKPALEDIGAIEPGVFEYYRTFCGLGHGSNGLKSTAHTSSILIDVPTQDAVPTEPLSSVYSDAGGGAALNGSQYNEQVRVPTTETLNAEPRDDSARIENLVQPVVVASNGTSIDPLPLPTSLDELYSLIIEIGQHALADLDTAFSAGQSIRGLLDRHLQHLIDLRSRMTDEEALRLIDRYCNQVLQLVEVLAFEESEQRDLVPVLRAAWKAAVISALEDGRPKAWFEVNLNERQQMPELVDRFNAERTRIAVATGEIEEIRNQLVDAKFTARAALKAKETQKSNEINSANQELETIRVEVAHYLVPEGRSLDDLMEGGQLSGDIEIDVAELQPQALIDLQAVLFEPSPGEQSPAYSSSEGNPAQSTSAHQRAELFDTNATDDAISQKGHAADSNLPIESELNLEEDPAEAVLSDSPAESSVASEDELASPPQSTSLPEPSEAIGAPETVEEPVDALEDREGVVASSNVDQALKHLHWTESAEEAQQAFRIAYDQYSQVPRYVVESVALHWIAAGHINVAAQILRDASDSTLVADRVLDAGLLRSAFYGMNLWPKDREALSFTQRDLNLLNHKDLEDQLERKPTGKIVPYLLVCATLQPALFAGGQTQAATFLRLAADHFDGHLSRLISGIADFSLRGGRVDLDLLRNEQAQDTRLAADRLIDQVNAWVDVNQQRTNRWHILRQALRNCIKRPELSDAINAIKDGENGNAAAVQLFVQTFSSHTESRRLLDELVVELRADAPVTDRIDSPAYVTFCHQMDGLVSIANAWMIEVAPVDVRPKDVEDFLQRFRTLLERSIHALENHPGYADLEHRAGSVILLKCLRRLQNRIKTETHDAWRFDLTDAAFRLPETLARLDMGNAGVDLRLEWFAMRLASQSWLADMLSLSKRQNAHWVRLLVLRQLDAEGESYAGEIDAASNDIAGVRAAIKKDIERFRNLSLQATSVDLIGEGEHLANVDQVAELLEALSDRRPYVDVSDIEQEVQQRVRSLDKLLNGTAAGLEDELNRELLSIRVKLGQDAVPDGWEKRARQALEKRSLSLVRELINQLKEHSERNARLVETFLFDNAQLTAFLQVEGALANLLHEHPNPREAGERVISEAPGGLDYAAFKANFKDAIGILLEWRSKGKNRKSKLERQTYDGIVTLLRFLGLDVPGSAKDDALNSCEYTPTGDFRRLKVRVSRPTLPKGFPLFGGDIGSAQPLDIVFVQGDWSQAGLVDLVERHGQPDRSILMVGHPLTLDERKAFATFCRDRKCTIFLLDPVVLSYVATSRHQQSTLETFLRVSAAWTFYNPYTKGDARLPAPPEMRFGRESNIASLVEPRGAALVYGGRQLGKTTLLNAAVQEFKKRDPKHNHAYYMPMDGVFQHVVERGINVKRRLFDQLVLKLVDDKVLANIPGSSQSDPEERLRQEFLRPGDTKVLFCLDEIDSVLNKDAATNFELVRSLKALVNDPHHRFRVVFAGLNNVNRFRTYPNVPLEQLGSPLEVGILSSQDARNLILQPLTALGYRFQEPELVDRIMAFTNCHPSLLHIFCSELVEQLGRDRSRADGVRPILQTDIENVENNSDVRRLSGERFDMTLNLDKRYTVAVYGLIADYDKSLAKFTVSKALEIARAWVPEEFEQMSESGFEIILQELVGLGVLRVDDKAKRLYALRNQSILQLLGSKDDIEHKLQQAITGLKNHEQDVLTCHATGSQTDKVPSPLSLLDERMILSAKPPEGAPMYSVSLVMGSPALGLTVPAMQDGFNAINEFQSGAALAKYETQVVKDAATVDLRKFAERIHTAIDSWASVTPAVVLISLEECAIDRIVDLISIANEKAAKATRLKHPLRVVFLLGPKAMWNWYSHSWLTLGPDEIGGRVDLRRWTSQACESLLEQQGMSSTTEQGEALRAATEGWHEQMINFIGLRKRKESASSLSDLSKTFVKVSDLAAKDFDKFMSSVGMNCQPWSLRIGVKLQEFDLLSSFSRADLETAIGMLGDEDPDLALTPDQSEAVIRWWTALRVVEVNTLQQSRDADREGAVTYAFVPSVQRAITEYRVRADGAKEAQA